MSAALDRDSPEYAKALLAAQMRRITRARSHPSHFYEYVMREETTRARIKLLPFQKLVFEFVMEHDRCVLRLPVGGSKTYMMAALTMFLLGEDPTARGAVISATQAQAAKPLSLVRNYIERSSELHAVYPLLRPSQVESDPWTQTAITVDRPFGIRDPSLVAVGVDGSIPGSRINWCLVDDILNLENTATADQREKVTRWFKSTVLSRLDVAGSRLVVTNTPYVSATSSDPGDLTYVLESQGWPTLSIGVWGDVTIKNDNAEAIRSVYELSPELGEPADPNVDIEEVVPFWPERFTRPAIEKIKKEAASARDFAMNYEMKARGNSEERIQEGWIRQAKTDARRLGHIGFVSDLDTVRHRIALSTPVHPVVTGNTATEVSLNFTTATGVDSAIGKKKSNARTVLFTIAVLPPNNLRLILDIEAGRWSGREIVDKIIAKHQAYGSIVRVENNAAQDFLLQWTRETDVSVPIRAHTTGRNKADPTHGVESLFIEIEQGGWLMPCDAAGKSPKALEGWLQDLRQYTPEAHSGDFLMASWLADWQAKKQGAFVKRHNGPTLAALHYR